VELVLTSLCCVAAGQNLVNLDSHALVAALGSYKLAGQPREAVVDRVYRLHYNVNQNRTDRFCQVRHQSCPWRALPVHSTTPAAAMEPHVHCM
jgi:hypothetical protein